MSIFYKITAPNGKVSHIFGTLHINDDAVVTLPLEVKKAFDGATSCIFEAPTLHADKKSDLRTRWMSNVNVMQINLQYYINKVTRHLDEMLETADFDMADKLKAVKNNIHYLSPLEMAKYLIGEKTQQKNTVDIEDTVDILDQQLINSAFSKKRKIDYLEKPEEQVIVANGYNLDFFEQEAIYDFIYSELNKGTEFPGLEDLKRAYQEQDSDKLKKLLLITPEARNAPESVKKYNYGIGANRDRKMAEGMKHHLEQGNAFVAVGACHLKGITDILKTQGYTIEPVTLGKRYYPIDGTIEDGDKVAAFRKIYTALYMAQTSFFKKRGFIPIDDMIVSLKSIQDYIEANKDTRSHKAWELAQKHYQDTSSNNKELLKSICQEGYAKSSSFFGLFRRTKTNLDDEQSVKEASAKTRTGAVRDILNSTPQLK